MDQDCLLRAGALVVVYSVHKDTSCFFYKQCMQAVFILHFANRSKCSVCVCVISTSEWEYYYSSYIIPFTEALICHIWHLATRPILLKQVLRHCSDWKQLLNCCWRLKHKPQSTFPWPCVLRGKKQFPAPQWHFCTDLFLRCVLRHTLIPYRRVWLSPTELPGGLEMGSKNSHKCCLRFELSSSFT